MIQASVSRVKHVVSTEKIDDDDDDDDADDVDDVVS